MGNLLKYGNDYNVDQWLNQLTIRPSENFINNLNTFVSQLKLNGIWTELDAMWIFATEQQQHAQIDIKSGRTLTEVNSPIWTANSGYTGVVAGTKYLNTNYIAATQGINYTKNNASFGAYVITNVVTNSSVMGFTNSSTSFSLLPPRTNANQFLGYLNNGGGSGGTANNDSRGFFTLTRNSNINFQGYKNGVSQFTGNDSTTTLTNSPFLICTYDGSNIYSGQTAMVYIGSGNINQTAFYNIIQNFAINRGFNV